jgi:1-deoxy-D-xylulose-5-phosphate reductoisomerase
VREDDFPALKLGLEAGRAGGLMPAVFNAANEQAVALFLQGSIGFRDIPRAIYSALQAHQSGESLSRESVSRADAQARQNVLDLFVRV